MMAGAGGAGIWRVATDFPPRNCPWRAAINNVFDKR